MSSSLNSEPATKQQAYRDLLKYDIKPQDKIFPARETINKLSSIGHYLLAHSITFEEHHIINQSDNWDTINPQSAFTFNSLEGYHAPNRNKVGTHGVVFTFNNNANGTYQFVITNKGLAYRQIGLYTPWLYLGQGLPSDINVTQIVDQQHLRNFFNGIKAFYVNQGQLKKVTNSQEVTNYNLKSANDSLNSKTNHELYSSGGKLSSLQASANSNFDYTSNEIKVDSNNNYNSFENIEASTGSEFDSIYDSFVPSYTTQTVNSMAGSYETQNGISNYNTFSFGSNVPNYNHSESTYTDNNGVKQSAAGSVYTNASLINDAFNKIGYNSSANETYLKGPFTQSLTSVVSNDASSYANSALTVNNTRGQGYINSSNITSLSNSTADAHIDNVQRINSTASYAHSVGTVYVPKGFKAEQTLLSVGSIQPTNGTTILGNGYQADFNDISLGNSTSEAQAQSEIIDQANSLTYEDVNSFISRESTFANNGQSLLLSNSNTSNSINDQGSSDLNDARQEDLKDINMYRKQAGLPPLQFSTEDQIIADLRLDALRYVYYSTPDAYHNDPTVHGIEKVNGKQISDYELKIIDGLQLDKEGSVGENAASWHIGHETYSNPGYTQPSFTIRKPLDAADAITDVSMNFDEAQQDGHRNNILNPQYKYVGIAYSVDKNGNGIQVEEFSTDSEDKIPLLNDPIDISKLDFYFNLLPSDNAYSKYVLSNAISVTPGDTYNVSAFISNNSKDHLGVIGITNSPYLAQYENPINPNSWKNNTIADINKSESDLKNQLEIGYINYNFVPKAGVTKIWLVGIPLLDNGTPVFTNTTINLVKPMGPVETVNSVASQNANTIATLENANQILNDKINYLTNDENENYNDFIGTQEHFDSLDNNPTMSLVATKSIASSLSDQESYSNPTVFTYPRFTSATGVNSRTEEEAIDWCNSSTGGNIPICTQDLQSNVLGNVERRSNESYFEYMYRIENITKAQTYINKAKVAAILGIIETKTDFGESGDDPQNYLGYRDYHDEYSDIQPYLTNILAQTVGAWKEFQGGFTWDRGSWYLSGITPEYLAQSADTSLQNVKNNLPYFLAYWLDYQIDNSNVDMDQCGSNAKNLINELY